MLSSKNDLDIPCAMANASALLFFGGAKKTRAVGTEPRPPRTKPRSTEIPFGQVWIELIVRGSDLFHKEVARLPGPLPHAETALTPAENLRSCDSSQTLDRRFLEPVIPQSQGHAPAEYIGTGACVDQ